MMLKDKVAVVYSGGGSIGSAVARAFAAEGARVFLAGRTMANLDVVAKEIGASSAEVDATDEQSVERNLATVVEQAGAVDISFDAIGLPNSGVLGLPLVDLDADAFAGPLMTHAKAYFLTARAAARRMIPNGSGVIMTVTALHSRTGIPLAGGYGPAQAVKESLTRHFSAELAPHGIRVVGLRPQAMPETPTIRDAFEPRAEKLGMTWEQWQQTLASRTHPRRLMSVRELADVAAFMASDRASGITGSTVNLTMGSLDD